MVNLRPYQIEARDAVLGEWQSGRKKTLLVLPTGTGKTIVFSSVIKERVENGAKALILAHRSELLTQAQDKLYNAFGIPSSLEQAKHSALGSQFPVTVGSVQTLSQEHRLRDFSHDYFSDIIVDEAHHCMSDSYKRVLDHFPDANVLGVTATPDRADQKNLGQFFDSKAYEYTMHKAIKEGFLSPIKAQMIPLQVDLTKVSVQNGDYSAGEVDSALDPYLEKIAEEMQIYCRGRKTVVFLPLVKTSQKFCALLREKGFRAAEVNGDSKDRDEILRDFESGKFDVLCNSMLLTEGWDCPSVDCIVILRPTKIRGLYQQMVGRGMRLSPGKKNLLLLDFLWLTTRHDLCRPSALVSRDEKLAQKIDRVITENGECDLLEAEETAESDVLREREEALALELAEMKKRKRTLVDPIQYALSIADEDLASYVPSFAWEMAPASDKQLAYLESHGIFPDTVQSAGMASMIISKLKNRQSEGLATPKQIRCLERFGFSRVGTWEFEAASSVISRLAMNNWHLPRGMNPKDFVPKTKTTGDFIWAI